MKKVEHFYSPLGSHSGAIRSIDYENLQEVSHLERKITTTKQWPKKHSSKSNNELRNFALEAIRAVSAVDVPRRYIVSLGFAVFAFAIWFMQVRSLVSRRQVGKEVAV